MDDIHRNSSRLEDSKLGKLLSKLEKEDIRLLSKFLRSPWFGAGEAAVRLFDVIGANGQISALKTPKEELMSTLRTDPKTFNKMMNSLLSAVEKYFVQRELERDETTSRKLLLRAARRYKSKALFRENAALLLRPDDARQLDYADIHGQFHVEFQVLSEIYFHPETDKFRSHIELLPNTISALERYYLTCKLFFACEVFNRKQFMEEATEIPDLERAVSLATNFYAGKCLIIDLYLGVLELLRNGHDDQRFERVSRLFITNIAKIGASERRAILTFLVNHANYAFRTGAQGYLKNVLRLYIAGLRHNLLWENGEMSPATFENVANTAVICKRFAFAKGFIQRYQTLLPAAERKATVDISLAFLNFHQGNFKDAYLQAYRAGQRSPRHALIAKPLMLRSNYEEIAKSKSPQDVPVLLDNLEAFNRYLSRNRTLNSLVRQSYKHFVSVLHGITLAIANGYITTKSKKRLLKILQQKKPPFSKGWLEKKLQELPEKPAERQVRRPAARKISLNR